MSESTEEFLAALAVADEELERDAAVCRRCGAKRSGGPDACLGMLPGVANACCGHGTREGYIQFTNGVTLRFDNVSVERS